MSRGWTWISEDSTEAEHLTPTLNALAAEWSAITDEIEQESFRRQAAREDGYDDGPDCDNEDCTRRHPCEECAAIYASIRERSAAKQVKLEIIEAMLEKYGARIMRPYEHWNEDERYMEYQESRYDY